MLDELATNKELLNKLNLVSEYADQPKDKAVEFFTFYLSSFTQKSTNSIIKNNTILRILILEPKLLQEVQKNLLSLKKYNKYNDIIRK